MSGMLSLRVMCKDQRGRGYHLPSTGPRSLLWRDGIWPDPLASPCTLGRDRENKNKEKGGDGMYVHGFRLGGGSVTSPDVKRVGSRKGRLGGRTTRKLFFSCQGLSSMYSFSGPEGGGGLCLAPAGGCRCQVTGRVLPLK